MKHLSTLIAVKKLTIIQFTKIIQDLFYLDEFILDSLIIHLENCTIYHDESAIAFCIQYQNNDYEYIFNETKQNIYLSINKRNNQFIDLITYLKKYHFLNNNHFSYIQPNIKNMNDLNQVIEFIENKTIVEKDTILAMDTQISWVIYEKPSLYPLDLNAKIKTRINELVKLLSVTDENSEIYKVNHHQERDIKLSEDTKNVVLFALQMAEKTNGALEPTIYPVLREWGFTTGKYQISLSQSMQ